MLPGRASDAGPDGRKYCPSCGSAWRIMLADCATCGTPTCDRCPGAEVEVRSIVCGKCAKEAEEDGMECDCRFTGDQADASVCRLHQVAARVRHANIPEWEADKPCPF